MSTGRLKGKELDDWMAEFLVVSETPFIGGDKPSKISDIKVNFISMTDFKDSLHRVTNKEEQA